MIFQSTMRLSSEKGRKIILMIQNGGKPRRKRIKRVILVAAGQQRSMQAIALLMI